MLVVCFYIYHCFVLVGLLIVTGAIFLVPYAAQMALNSLATATAVSIYLKRHDLALKHFRILTGCFAPVVIFMSTYAVWNLEDEFDETDDGGDASS